MKLGSLLDGAGVKYCLAFRDLDVTGVTDDSRRVAPGNLFVAVRGSAADGHRYLLDALTRGASAAVVEVAGPALRVWPKNRPLIVVNDARRAASAVAASYHGRPARRVKVVGVTGTNGKTTVTWLLRSILRAAGYRAGVVGTIAHEGDGWSSEASTTTPGPMELHALLRRMEAAGNAFAAMEVSSHALDQGRTADVPFAGAIFTNVTSDHLDYHGTRASYLQAKARLFRDLAPGSIAVLNGEDWASAVFAGLTEARTVFYGRGPSEDLRYRVVRSGLRGSTLAFRWRGRDLGELAVRLPGLHNAANAAAAAAFCLAARMDFGAIREGIESMAGVPGRLEPVEIEAPFRVFVDYAHTEDALRAVLRGLRAVHEGRILLVFGCGGDRDRTKRPRMGRIAGELADLVWVTSDNPRSEDPDAIIRDIERGIPFHAWYAVQTHRKGAILEALQAARPGDAVLVAGKGHEQTQTVGNEVHRFCDKEAVREAWDFVSSGRRRAAVARSGVGGDILAA